MLNPRQVSEFAVSLNIARFGLNCSGAIKDNSKLHHIQSRQVNIERNRTMRREIEKDKTYRIPYKNGTDLLQIVSLDPFKVKNLKSGKTESMDKQSFQERLNNGEIYVSAQRNSAIICKRRNLYQIITILRKLIAATTTGISDVHLTEYVKKQMDKLEKKNKPVFDKTTTVIQNIRENFKHPALETHEYKSGKGPSGEKLLRSVITKSMGGWRLHWYKPKNTSNIIVIIDIIKHE